MIHFLLGQKRAYFQVLLLLVLGRVCKRSIKIISNHQFPLFFLEKNHMYIYINIHIHHLSIKCKWYVGMTLLYWFRSPLSNLRPHSRRSLLSAQDFFGMFERYLRFAPRIVWLSCYEKGWLTCVCVCLLLRLLFMSNFSHTLVQLQKSGCF